MRLLTTIMILLLCGSVSAEEVDPRVIKLSGCTGFMVDGNYLVTAKHCVAGLTNRIIFRGKNKKVAANLIYVTEENDGPAIYYLPGSDESKRYKSFKMASSPPNTGEKVHTIGYPGGNYGVLYGSVRSGDGRTYNRVTMRISPGNSGAPLLNENDEVVGIAEAVDIPIAKNNSYFCSWRLVNEAIQEAKSIVNGKRGPPTSKQKAELVIFTANWCSSCKVLESELDIPDLNRRGIKVIKVNNSSSGSWDNASLVSEFRKSTGKDVSALPTIWLRGSDRYKTGYTSGTRFSLLGWIIQGFKTVGTLLFGNGPNGEIKYEEAPLPPNNFSNEEAPLPEAENPPPKPDEVKIETIDWENISIIIAAKKTDVSGAKALAFSAALRAIRGPIMRANEEMLEGKANLFFIDERTQPNRYSSFVSAAGIAPNPFYIMVLVKKQSLGLKGIIAAKVEEAIKDKIPGNAPLELVFERVHNQSYGAITQSLTVTDEVEPISSVVGSGGSEFVDWENVSIVIAVKKTTTAYVKGAALSVFLRTIKGPITRANEEIFDGKAKILFLDERTQPERYSAFIDAAGVIPDPIYVMVLVKNQDLGIKGILVNKVEQLVDKKLPKGSTIEIIFERIHRESYGSIVRALEAIPPISGESTNNLKEDILDSVRSEIGEMKGEMQDSIGIALEKAIVGDGENSSPIKDGVVKDVMKNIGPALDEISKKQDQEGEDRTFFERMMAALLALMGVGQLTGGIKGYLANKAMKELKERISDQPQSVSTK